MSDEKKEHPIIFSGPMVQAILEGKKTMTRRVIKAKSKNACGIQINKNHFGQAVSVLWYDADERTWDHKGNENSILCPYGRIGDILWVREAFNIEQYPVAPEGDKDELLYYYKATEKEFTDMRWKPSIHMPKEASRISLEVTNIRIEKLQSISEEDIISEGVRYHVSQDNHVLFQIGGENRAWDFMPEQWKLDQHVENRGKEKHVTTEKEIMFAHWAELWCEINGKDSWDANPWVWAISFKTISKK